MYIIAELVFRVSIYVKYIENNSFMTMKVPMIMEKKILVMEICSSRGAGCLLQGIMCKKLTRTKQPFTNESIPPLNINPSTT